MTVEPETQHLGEMTLQMIRDKDAYQTELLRLSVEREKILLEKLRQDLRHQGWRSASIGALLCLGIMLGIEIFALLEKLPAIIEALKH